MPVMSSKQVMLRSNTPIEHYPQYGLWVKREDLSCPLPGPPFSKARGVFAHLLKRPEKVIGVLDTSHSQAGWAVARACQILGKQCINYYPAFKANPGPHVAQLKAQGLGAKLKPLPAGRSAILFHAAKKDCLGQGGYMMPNALKLGESVTETAKEVPNESFDNVLIPISSGTIAAGVMRGFADKGHYPKFLVHLGYTRSHEEVTRYLMSASDTDDIDMFTIIDEEYAYKDKAKDGETPPWPCNQYYDLKAFRWWLEFGEEVVGRTLFWNIG